MVAIPLIPGCLYSVRGAGVSLRIHATNPVDALMRGLCCAMAARSLS